MLSEDPKVTEALDSALIGFLTAVSPGGQPQSSPVWFHRDGDDLVVYNKPDTPRLRSIAQNPMVAFNLRGDQAGRGGLTMEGRAVADDSLPPPAELEGYLDKYAAQIERLGWTPESFGSDYSTPIRIELTRVRSWAVDRVIEGPAAG